MRPLSRGSQAGILVLATLGCVGLLPVGALAAIASPMVFDNPYNLENPLAWVAFMLVLGLWIVCLVAPYGAWVAFFKGRQQLQWIAIGSPFVWGLAMAVALRVAPH
jgi:hypothetical protein